MGNLYRLNSLFELEISQFGNSLEIEKALLDRSTALEYLFLLLSNPNDYTIVSEKPSSELLEYWEANNILFGKTIQTDTPYYAETLTLNKNFPKDTTLIEWGNTSVLDAENGILSKRKLLISRSSGRNSKIKQLNWKETLKQNQVLSILCSNKMELEYSFHTFELPIVIKTEFGFSGRGHYILKTNQDVQEITKRLPDILKLNPNGVIVEEWVENKKTQDFSGLFDLFHRKSELIAITKMLIDKNGSYRGSVIQKNFGKEFAEGMSSIIKDYTHNSLSYKGALSLDGFTFEKDNEIKIQYMSEINFRYSMGRVLYELHKKIGHENEDYALFFFPVKNKNLTFKILTTGLSKIKTEFKTDLLLLTPLTNANAQKNPFLVFYVRNQKQLPLIIMDAIKKLLS